MFHFMENLSAWGISIVNDGAKSLSQKTVASYGQIPHFLKPFTAVAIVEAWIKALPKICYKEVSFMYH